MYRLPDQYQHGVQVDGSAEQELRRWAVSQPEADWAFEDRAPHSGHTPPDERCEREYTRMEVDSDPNARFHDGRDF